MEGSRAARAAAAAGRADVRLIERWLPIAALGEESARERRSLTGVASAQLPARLVGAAAVGGLARGGAGLPAAR
ncbi:MAG: hypothetical protein RML45_04355 [Acetobacteraceae bacterium]|nr:hypothetical protein [Acetobacteraceae bacterium]